MKIIDYVKDFNLHYPNVDFEDFYVWVTKSVAVDIQFFSRNIQMSIDEDKEYFCWALNTPNLEDLLLISDKVKYPYLTEIMIDIIIVNKTKINFDDLVREFKLRIFL
jgi:hypothetical protein